MNKMFKYNILFVLFVFISAISIKKCIEVDAASKVINVKDYGAVGDGINDDTDSINLALKQNTGKKIYFPTGVYLISEKINVLSNTTIIGDGANSVILAAEGKKAGTEIFQLNNVQNVDITGICISGNSSVNYGNDYNDIDGIHMFDMWNAENVQIKNCYFIDNIYCAIRIFGGKQISIAESTFLNVDCGIVALGNENVYDLTISQCYFNGHKNSEAISLYGRGTYEKITIVGNNIENKTFGHGILLNDQSINKDISITENTISNCAVGISAFMVSSGLIENNAIIGTTSGRGMEIYNCNKIYVKNNEITDTNFDSLSIKNCNMSAFTNNNILISSNAKNKNMTGIRVNGICTGVVVSNNLIKRMGNSLSQYGICVDSNGSVRVADNSIGNMPIYISESSRGVNIENNK